MLANSLSLHGMDKLPVAAGEGMLVYLRNTYGAYRPGIYITDQGKWKSVNQISVLTGMLRVITTDALGASVEVDLTAEEVARLKGLSSSVQDQLDSKATNLAVNQALSSKVESGVMAQALLLKLDSTVAAQTYATKTALTEGLATKSDKSAVDQALSARYTKAEDDALLDKKADKAAMTTALNSKSDKAATDQAIGLKADKSIVEGVLIKAVETFYWHGALTTSSAGGLRWTPPFKVQIVSIQAWLGAPSTGLITSTAVWDVRKNGVTVLTTAERPTIPIGASASQKTVPATPVILETTDYLTAHVITAGGTDGSLRIEYKAV